MDRLGEPVHNVAPAENEDEDEQPPPVLFSFATRETWRWVIFLPSRRTKLVPEKLYIQASYPTLLQRQISRAFFERMAFLVRSRGENDEPEDPCDGQRKEGIGKWINVDFHGPIVASRRVLFPPFSLEMIGILWSCCLLPVAWWDFLSGNCIRRQVYRWVIWGRPNSVTSIWLINSELVFEESKDGIPLILELHETV